MLDNKLVILCPEIVPLDNKGEEAIIKGIMDVKGLSEDNCYYQVIDHSVKSFRTRNGILVHPLKLFVSEWRTKEYGLGFSTERIYSSLCAIVRHGLNHIYPKWVHRRPKAVRKLARYIQDYKAGKTDKIPTEYQEAIKYISNTDYIIAGHNGGLNENVCHILLALHEIGYKYCIFGSCMKPSVKGKEQLALYDKMFSKADVVISRNPIGFRWYESNFKYPGILAPDPAYYMQSSNKDETSALIHQLGLTDFFKKPVLMVTTAEPAPISLRSFDAQPNRMAKIKTHRAFLGEIVSALLKNTDYNILLLPHTIGPEKHMDDRLISLDALHTAGIESNKNGRCYVLDADLTCRELKGLIAEAHLLIAERVHSVIGAVGVHTPFIVMGSNKDNRINGMLVELAGLGEYVYHLNTPTLSSFLEKFRDTLQRRDEIVKHLEKVDTLNREQLAKAASLVELPQTA